MEDEDENQESILQKKSKLDKPPKIMKDPNVDTDFLPDKERERQEEIERIRLRKEWEELQERIKGKDNVVLSVTSWLIGLTQIDEQVTVTYSYWDGSGHRRELTVGYAFLLLPLLIA